MTTSTRSGSDCPGGVVPLCNNTALSAIRAVMPECDSHGVVPTWLVPSAETVQAFFDNLVEKPRNAEERKGLTQETTARDVAYIASRMEEAAAAAAAGEFGYTVDEAEAADAVSQAEEEEILKLLQITPEEFAGEPTGEPAGIGEAAGQGTESSGPAEEEEEEEEAKDVGGNCPPTSTYGTGAPSTLR